MSSKTYTLKAGDIDRRWYVVDAEGKTLGRLSSDVAYVLRGKHKPRFTPHMDNGDYVIIVNADKIRVTGRRAEQKVYYSHSGYPGGLKERAVQGRAARRTRGASWSTPSAACSRIPASARPCTASSRSIPARRTRTRARRRATWTRSSSRPHVFK